MLSGKNAIHKMSSELIHPDNTRGFHLATAAIVFLWYCVVYFAVHPLTEAPVGDSWVYEHAVVHLNQTGRIQFPGFTQAMPVVQVLYGAAWSRLFGDTSRSLDLSTAVLGIFGGLLFYGLARKSGAAPWSSAAATALLICNPCYLLMSFSFMTEIPFLVALLASYFAFASATHRSPMMWLWLAAICAAASFGIRPFAGATIAGETAALLMFSHDGTKTVRLSKMSVLIPFIAALGACAGFWIWLTVLNPKPWMLEYNEHRLREYFTLVPFRDYLLRGVLEPALYLGTVLSPLAVLHAFQQWRRSIVISAAIPAASIVLIRLTHEQVWNLEQFGCFGGSSRALVLSGSPQLDFPAWLGWMLVIVGSVGIAGICNALRQAIQHANPTVLAVLVAAAIYWAAMPFLWFFSDRYDLVLVPAACLLLALAPLPRSLATAAGLMTAVLALVSAAGLFSYHRTMQTIVLETNDLVRQGVSRKQIDAGYSLNGRDLYVYPTEGMDTQACEPKIPGITTGATLPYTIATSPVPNTVVWRRFSGRGPLGFGDRLLFVLRTTANPWPVSP